VDRNTLKPPAIVTEAVAKVDFRGRYSPVREPAIHPNGRSTKEVLPRKQADSVLRDPSFLSGPTSIVGNKFIVER
jgi:hypothetical protein